MIIGGGGPHQITGPCVVFHQMYRDNPTSWCHQSWGRFCDKLLMVMIGVITLAGLAMIDVVNSIGPILIISVVPAIIAAKVLVWFIKEFIFITPLLLSEFTDWLFDNAD